MFWVFVTKQTSKFCGTNRQLSRINPAVKNVCPSCGCRNESSNHLTRCRDAVRTQLFEVSVSDLVRWMSSTKVCGELIGLVRRYLLARGRRTMVQVLDDSRSPLIHLARAHDKLGWRNFLEGRICSLYIEHAARTLPERRSPTKWGSDFLSRLLQITHRQWLLRNAHVHYRKLEGLTEAEHLAILSRLRELIWTDPADLLECHRYLLEVDFNDLGSGSSARRQVWIASLNSALRSAEAVRSVYRPSSPSSRPRSHSPHSARPPRIRHSQDGSMVYRRSRLRTT